MMVDALVCDISHASILGRTLRIPIQCHHSWMPLSSVLVDSTLVDVGVGQDSTSRIDQLRQKQEPTGSSQVHGVLP